MNDCPNCSTDVCPQCGERYERTSSRRDTGTPCDPYDEDGLTWKMLRYLRRNDYLDHDAETIVRLTFRRLMSPEYLAGDVYDACPDCGERGYQSVRLVRYGCACCGHSWEETR